MGISGGGGGGVGELNYGLGWGLEVIFLKHRRGYRLYWCFTLHTVGPLKFELT